MQRHVSNGMNLENSANTLFKWLHRDLLARFSDTDCEQFERNGSSNCSDGDMTDDYT